MFGFILGRLGSGGGVGSPYSTLLTNPAPTNDRDWVSNSSSDVYVQQSDGTLELFAAGEIPYKDGSVYHVPAATNLIPYSSDFSDASWIKTFASVTANTTTAPDGTLTADTLVDDNGGGIGFCRTYRGAVTLTADTDYTYSVFAKANGNDWLYIQFSSYDENAGVYFDLTNGLVGTEEAGIVASSISELANGWYRCSVTYNTTTDTTGACVLAIAEGDLDNVVDRDGTSSVYVWGAQLEQSSFATPIIPTSGSTVTRNATDISTPLIQESGYGTEGDGVELVTNGTFDSDSNWTLYGAGASYLISDNKITITNGVDGNDGVYQIIQTQSGVTYNVKVTTENGTSTETKVLVGTGVGNGSLLETNGGSRVVNTTFTATGATSYISLQLSNIAGATGSYSSISIQRVKRNFTNFKQTEGTLHFKFIADHVAGSGSTGALFTINDATTGVLYHDSGALKSTDGTNTATVSTTWTAGDEVATAVRWSAADDELQIGYAVNGGSWTWGTASSYDDTFASGTDVNLCYTGSDLVEVVSLKTYDKTLTTAEIEALS